MAAESDPLGTLADRLAEAGLGTERFVDVEDGDKVCLDHTRVAAAEVEGNVGLYAGDGLVLEDDDDYHGEADRNDRPDLPRTFTIRTPHGGRLRVYAYQGDATETVEAAHGSATNPTLPWGDLRVHNQYSVVPPSRLDGCGKDWCDSCATADGGRYELVADRPIAEIGPGQLTALAEAGRNGSEPGQGREVRPNGGVAAAQARTSRPVPTVDYEPVEDPPDAEAVVDAEPWLREYLDGGAGDRSKKDFAACCTLAEYGVPEADARALLDASPKTKIHDRPDLWPSTWARAVNQVDVASKAVDADGGEPSGPTVPVLPPVEDSEPWDWQAAARGEAVPTQDDYRARCHAAIFDAVEDGKRVVVSALPTLGKSHATALVAAETGRPITYLTHLRKNRKQVADWAREAGLRVYTIRPFRKTCPTALGEHGEDLKRRVRGLMQAGVRPNEIHKRVDPPCQAEGRCPHTARWDFDAEDWDLIIGWPGHARIPRIVNDRAVIFDEDPGTNLAVRLSDRQLERAVNAYLDGPAELCVESFDALLAARDSPNWKGPILGELADVEDLRDVGHAVDTPGARADAPALAYAVLAAEDLGNGFDRATLPTGQVVVWDRKDGGLTVRDPPSLADAHAVVGLDGTPTKAVWRGRLGLPDLELRQVLDAGERREYLRDVLGHRYIQTTDNIKPYLSGNHVDVEGDTELLRRIGEHHDEAVPLISSKAALAGLVEDGGPAAEHVDGTMHYGDVKSRNDFADRQVGVVLGSPQLSDREIERLAALDGHTITPDRVGWDGVSFGDLGDRYLRHTRDNQVAQATLRFGRNGEGAVIYVATGAVPGWLPTERPPQRGEGERKVLESLKALGSATTPELAERVDKDRAHVSRLLHQLAKEGHADKRPTDKVGIATTWVATVGDGS